MNFRELLNELKEVKGIKITPKAMNKQKQEVVIYHGRYQPFHGGHEFMANKAKKEFPKAKLVIGLIKGKATSTDKTKNPFPFDYQKKIIKKAVPNAKIVEFKTGFLPQMILELREMGYEPVGYIAGEDRIVTYKRQLSYFDKIREEVPEFESPDIKNIDVIRDFRSATGARESLKNNDFEEFKKIMPKALHKEFETMKGYME